MAAIENPTFEAVITPHRSLSAAGLRRLVAVILLLSGMVSTVFYTLGAWPVLLFNGGEVLLAIALLRLNATRRRAEERLRLWPGALAVIRTEPSGRRHERRLDAAWIQAVLEDRPGRTPALLLVDRGRQYEIAQELGETEKRDLARALRDALHGMRNPRFDNPQLEGRGA